MIRIRTITYTLPQQPDSDCLHQVRSCGLQWSDAFPAIHTQRVVLPPTGEALSTDILGMLENFCATSDVRWYNIPINPGGSDDPDALFHFAKEVIARSGKSFVNMLAIQDGILDGQIVHHCIELFREVAGLSANGRDNFRLGCSFNVTANGPFFPFTFSDGQLGFSIGLEFIEDVNVICRDHVRESLPQLRDRILAGLIPEIDNIYTLAQVISRRCDLPFWGFDFSLAPVIAEYGSVLPLLSRLGIYNFGGTGTLFATSFYTDLIKSMQVRFPSVGFSGVMYSVLEDLGLCMINNEKGLRLDDLIKVSTMCGCGVDMLPVCRDITNEELRSIFWDVYAISTRLHKPLGIRILPIPSATRQFASYTNFTEDADFIANTRVIQTDSNLSYATNEQFSYLTEPVGH